VVYAFIIIGGRDGAVVVGSGGVPVSAAPGTKFVVQTNKVRRPSDQRGKCYSKC
jgi:hypothetical protein